MMEKSILVQLLKSSDFSDEELHTIGAAFTQHHFKKGDIVMHDNQKVLHTHYVYSGCLRTYYLDYTGKEHTLQFAIKDWWISDYTAFYTGTSSIMNIECIQDAVIYKLSRKSMEQLYLDIPKFETLFRKKLEKSLASFQKRTIGNLALSAKDRYLTFVKTYPNIEQSIKNYHIASYLGIAPESLSRIRKELAQE